MSSSGSIPDGRAKTFLPGLSRVASGRMRADLSFANRSHSAWDSATSTQTSPAAGDVDRSAAPPPPNAPAGGGRQRPPPLDAADPAAGGLGPRPFLHRRDDQAADHL